MLNNKTHLLYILLTTNCPVKCDFCMTTELHGSEDLQLDSKTLKSLDELMEGARKICFSGEGETLMAWRSILELLKRPGSGRVFEIITSAFWPYKRLSGFLTEVEKIVAKNNDICNLRVSVDEFHSAKVKHNNVANLLSRFIRKDASYNLSLGFRSITGQEEFVQRSLEDAANDLGYAFTWEQKDPLRHSIEIGGRVFAVEYKNIVSPGLADLTDPCPLEHYIKILEKRYERPFTLGSLEYSDEHPGFDITVNPNGDVVFYGMENVVVGNINNIIVDYDEIGRAFSNSDLCRTLYKTPFLEVLNTLRNDSQMSQLIDEVNNPYWIVRNAEDKMPGRISKLLADIHSPNAAT